MKAMTAPAVEGSDPKEVSVVAASLIPTVVQESPRGDRAFDIYSLLLRERIVFLGQEVDDQIANLIVSQMLFLEAQDPEKDISLYINSPGGMGYAGMAIYDVMQHVRPEVSTICVGMGMSAAAMILAGGAPGKATGAAQLPDHDPSGIGRNPRRTARHGDPTARSSCHHAPDGRDHRSSQRTIRRASRSRHRPRQFHDGRRSHALRPHRRHHHSPSRTFGAALELATTP